MISRDINLASTSLLLESPAIKMSRECKTRFFAAHHRTFPFHFYACPCEDAWQTQSCMARCWNACQSLFDVMVARYDSSIVSYESLTCDFFAFENSLDNFDTRLCKQVPPSWSASALFLIPSKQVRPTNAFVFRMMYFYLSCL